MLSIVVLAVLFGCSFSFMRSRPSSKYAAAAVIVLLNVLAIEVLSYGYLLLRIRQGSNFYMIGNQLILDKLIKMDILSRIHAENQSPHTVFELDGDLGYQPRPEHSNFQFKDTNFQRMRAERPYYFVPSKDDLRLAVFGDSFVYCDGEVLPNTWPYLLEKNVKNLEVLNFGVSGYGLVQSYLRFINKGLKYNPDVVFFNYIETTDRDQTPALSILGGRSLTSADLYRVNVEFKENFLSFKSYSTLDLFDSAFREKFIYGPAGFPSGRGLFNSKVFSVLNLGVVLKQWLAPLWVLRNLENIQAQKPPDLRINLRILKNILRIAKHNRITVIFFVGKGFGELPAEIQQILKEYSSEAVYINSKELFQKLYVHRGLIEKDLLNATNHFNARGNGVYAEAVMAVLAGRTWGRTGRVFKLDPKAMSFIPVP